MPDIREKLILLHRTPHLTRKIIRQLKKYDPTLQVIFTSTPSEITRMLHIPIEKSNTIYSYIHDVSNLQLIQDEQKKIKIITIDDDVYPDRLRYISDAPLVLYIIGNLSLLSTRPMLSVIGTRKPSDNAQMKLSHIIKPLIEAQWTIISGLAYGIDSFAHQLTVDNDGKTIAILGSGFYHIYPSAHKNLGRRIVKNGLLISEYPPYVKPRKYHFPERNRIISGLSEGTLVVEAKERSGTMITVDQALDQGKNVYAIPGNPLVPQSAGCHRLIQDGAKLVTKPEDIIEEWPIY